jgi:hypothetical protein
MNINYDITPKPTLYKSRLYRSKLEARWAAFFDLCKWEYEYEPFDLNGWSPDFLIKGHTPILVEVKPTQHHFKFEKYENAIKGSRYEILFLEDGPFNADTNWGSTTILGRLYDDMKTYGWAMFGQINSSKLGFCHDLNSYICRISGGHDGSVPTEYGQTLKDLWIKAANEIMFLKPI